MELCCLCEQVASVRAAEEVSSIAAPTRLSQAVRSLNSMLSTAMTRSATPLYDYLGIVAFDTTSVQLVPIMPISDRAERGRGATVVRALENALVTVGNVTPSGGTALYSAIALAMDGLQGTATRSSCIPGGCGAHWHATRAFVGPEPTFTVCHYACRCLCYASA